MAQVNPITEADTASGLPKGAMKVTWSVMANQDIGKGVRIPHYADKTVQFSGVFGVGGTVVWEGSNDSTNGVDGTWLGLVDPQGTAISKTAAAVEVSLENPIWVRPHVTGGDGNTAINTTLSANTVRQA